jgi:hypothetical protein
MKHSDVTPRNLPESYTRIPKNNEKLIQVRVKYTWTILL